MIIAARSDRARHSLGRMADCQDNGIQDHQAEADRRFLREPLPLSRCSPLYLGIPVSTTHTITGAIMGSAQPELSAVRWGVATRIIWAWLLTIPFSA